MYLELAILLLLLLFIYKMTRKPPELPPGTFGMPFIGCLPGRSISQFFRGCREKYGDIFCVKLGTRIFVQICDYGLVKTAFSNPDLSGRPDLFSLSFIHPKGNAGIVASEGLTWINGRRFALRQLKDLGLFKSRIERSIQEEATKLVNYLKEETEKPLELGFFINVAVLNVIWRTLTSKHYELDDDDIKRFLKIISDTMEIIEGPVAILDIFPCLINIIPEFIKDNWMKVKQLRENRDELHKFIMEQIEEHKDTLDVNSPRDYIDLYLIEMEKNKDDPESTFRTDMVDLKIQMSDFFGAGSETTSSTLRWFCLFMAKYPEVQEKIQDELDAALMDGSLPSLDIKEDVPYLEAAINEVNRLASLVSLGGPHTALVDTKIGDYTIPKDVIVFANVEGIHRDPKYWEKPDEFYPEHFLDEEGKFKPKKDGYLPFSVGRRSYLGESLAKMELFHFAANLLYNFTIQGLEDEELSTEPKKMGIFNCVQPYKVVLTTR